MTPYNPQEIEDRFRRLPDSLKDQMMSIENSERIFKVGKKFVLTVEQTGFLAEECGYVVLGLTHPKDFVTRLSQHLGIDIQKAKTIAQEINQQIFFPLREMLKTAHQFEITQEPSAPIAPISGAPTLPLKPVSPPLPAAPAPKPTPPATPSVPPAALSIKPSMPPVKPAMPILPAPQIPTIKPAPIAPAPIPASPKVPPPLTPPQPTTLTPVSPPPVPLAPHQTPAPLAFLTPSAIQEKKPGLTTMPQSAPAPKIAEGIKSKEPAALTQTPSSPTHPPLAPSQIIQNKFLEEQKSKPPSDEPAIHRMKESLFAPASMPAQTPPRPLSAPGQQPPTVTPQPPPPPRVPPPEPPLKSVAPPLPRTSGDPYREPIE